MATAKARFLDASNADRRGGRHSTGVRWWIQYCVHGLGINPIQPRDASPDLRVVYEGILEDFGIWLVVYKPSGRQISAKSAGKYISTVRAWYARFYRPAVLGVGAERSRIADILKGAAREIEQPPPRERLGCTPADLRRGMDAALGGSDDDVMWEAALSFGFATLSRGCELALDGREIFEQSEHIVPSDVTEFEADGSVNLRVRMRKRKDLRVLRGKQALVVVAGVGGHGAHVDAVQAVRRWMQRRRQLGFGDERPLFCWASGVAITTRDVRDAVRRVMAAAGRDPSLYGAHSLRIGGATAALAAGVPPQLIRLMGRWSSDIYEIYTRMSVQAALRVGRAVSSADVDTFEGGFATERLELLPQELDRMQQGVAEEVGAGSDED